MPTELQYVPGIASDSKHEHRWGYEIEEAAGSAADAESNSLRWFKLLLQDRKASRPPREEDFALSPDLSSMSLANQPARSTKFVEPRFTFADTTRCKLRQLGLEPVKVVADFLSAVRKT